MTFGLSVRCSSSWKCLRTILSILFFSPLVTGEGLGEAALTLIFWFSWNLLLGLAHSLA